FWFFIAIVCLFTACICVNYDYDFFARIIVGERFIEQGILPYQDFLSYTPTHPWYDHEWGSGVIFYLMLKLFGPIGIPLLYSVMLWGTIFFVTQAQRVQKHAYPASIIFTIIFITLFFRLNPTLVRCQLFSFFFFALFIYILEKQRKSGTKLIWFIPLFTIIWNNLHGGVVAGLGLLFMYTVGEFLNRKNVKKYFLTLALSIPLLMINPYGIKYLKFLFSATTMTRKYITEWWTLFAHRHLMYYIYPAIFCVFGFITHLIHCIRKRKVDYTKLIILTVTIIEGIMHVKLLTLSLIATSALCYNDIFRLFIKSKRLLKPIENSLYFVIITIAFSIPLFSPDIARCNLESFPFYEVEFLKLNNIKGNIVAPFSRAGYVAYKLYPDNLIYMDGRYEEVYNDKEFNILRRYELGEDDWRTIINNYNTDILMPSKQTNIYKILQNLPDWIQIYDGVICGIFIKKENVKQLYIEPETNLDYYKKTMFYATHFGKKIKRK
ncbi:hypothetical protein IKQ21_08095, partial [bacterium]|nr:hypothetical protein [bacterium]